MVGVEADEVRGAGLGVVVKEGGGGCYWTLHNPSKQILTRQHGHACLPACQQ